MKTEIPKIIIILGPTASGKTSLAVSLAKHISGEIISVDSRQVYRGMDIGTGKDLLEYQQIPYHLIDLIDPDEEFSVSKFQKHATQAIRDIIARTHTPILCGGTGHYIKALIESYPFSHSATDLIETRQQEYESRENLYQILKERGLWEDRDWPLDSKRRMVRAIEKDCESKEQPKNSDHFLSQFNTRLFYIKTDRDLVREKIWNRLEQRFEEGMIEEVKLLLKNGISEERLMRFGLEYKWITRFLKKEIPYQEMVQKLYIDICRFSKRQMTFIRYLQKNGHTISPIEDKDQFLKETSCWISGE